MLIRRKKSSAKIQSRELSDKRIEIRRWKIYMGALFRRKFIVDTTGAGLHLQRVHVMYYLRRSNMFITLWNMISGCDERKVLSSQYIS